MRPSTEHLLVQGLMGSAQEMLGALAAEPADASARARADAGVTLAFAPIWNRVPLLILTLGQNSVACEGRAVLESEDDVGGLIPALRSAGIVSLTLVPGVDAGEMQLFLAAIDRARRGGSGGSSDLLTLLFRADFRHLTYTVEPGPEVPPRVPPQKGGARATPPNEGAGVREAVRTDVAAQQPSLGVVRLEKFDSTLYFLDEKEIEYLKSAIDEEYARDPAGAALSLLFDTLQAQTDPSVRAEVIGILVGLLPHLLGGGQLEAVASLLSESRRVGQEAALAKDHKRDLDQLRQSVSDPGALAQFFHAIEDGGVQPTPESMGVLLRELRPDAIRQVLVWPEMLTNRAASAMVLESVDALFTQWPHALARMLGAGDRSVVLAALDVAARCKLPEFVELVGEVARDQDHGTRVRVARTLATIGTAHALRHLVGLASDSDSDVRAVVFSAIASRPSRGALPVLEAALAAGDLEDRGEREKRALFEAYAAAAGPEGVTPLQSILRGKGLGGRRPSPHTRACAALALGAIGTPGARAALDRWLKDRDPLVRNAVNAALRGDT